MAARVGFGDCAGKPTATHATGYNIVVTTFG